MSQVSQADPKLLQPHLILYTHQKGVYFSNALNKETLLGSCWGRRFTVLPSTNRTATERLAHTLVVRRLGKQWIAHFVPAPMKSSLRAGGCDACGGTSASSTAHRGSTRERAFMWPTSCLTLASCLLGWLSFLLIKSLCCSGSIDSCQWNEGLRLRSP